MKRQIFNVSPKPVLVLTDMPVISEVDCETPYSSASNLELLKDLASVGIPQNIIHTDENGRKSIEKIIHTTYLTFNRPEKPDFATDFVRKKSSIPEDQNFVEVPFHKNLWVSETLWTQVEQLIFEIKEVNPAIIVTTGKWSFFWLYGLFAFSKTQGTPKTKVPFGGLAKHRGSFTPIWEGWKLPDIILYPMWPVTEKYRDLQGQRVLTEKARTLMKWDLTKLGELYARIKDTGYDRGFIRSYLYPNYNFTFGTSIEAVRDWYKEISSRLAEGELPVSTDIETRQNTIDCIGFCYELGKAFCIPFSTLANPSPWTFEEELEIMTLILKVMTDKNFRPIGQNYSYDSQFINKFWGINSQAERDTMIAAHSLYNTVPKSLDVLASIYCEKYTFWKNMQSHSMEDISK